MHWRNTTESYGWVAIGLHWLVALTVFALFGLGLWMVELTYYDTWYRTAPAIHKSVGMLLLIVMVGRVVWRWRNPQPKPHGNRYQRMAAGLAHGLLYVLLFALMLAGYLISTADGSSIEVFELFSVPAVISDLPQQEDVAGLVHEWLAWSLMALVALHGLAALKHQLLDRDGTLLRMLRPQ